MKKGWGRAVIGSLLMLVFLTGCGEQESNEVEAYYDTLRRHQTVTLPSGETTYDFAALQEINTDIYGWIQIPGTQVDYPVLQNPDDDLMYLYTVCDGREYEGGSVFTQASYNGTDFNDPVTVLYGNTMQDDTMFGGLQALYSGTDGTTGQEIILYLPEEVRKYTVFAAVPYDDTHILYTYDFSDGYWYDNFFTGIRNIRSLDAYFADAYAPEEGDRVVILSTSMKDGSEGRYLVMAVLQDDIAGSDGNGS